MSPQENQVLQNFLDQLTQVRGIAKDPQADALIAQAVARQPDAAYLLVQRTLLQDQALDAAKAQIAALQNQVRDARPFTGGGFLDAANSWGNSAGSGPRTAANQPPSPAQYERPAERPAPARAASPGFLSGGAGSFLGSMAATAAGVAGGAFLFQGIQNLLGQQGGTENPAQQGMAALPENTPADQSASDPAADNGDLAADAGFDDIGGFDDGSV